MDDKTWAKYAMKRFSDEMMAMDFIMDEYNKSIAERIDFEHLTGKHELRDEV